MIEFTGKVRETGGNMVVTIPKSVANTNNIKKGGVFLIRMREYEIKDPVEIPKPDFKDILKDEDSSEK